jgi:hypothetical protein
MRRQQIFFDYHRELDAREPACIAVAPMPREVLGEAINDRLRRAAAEHMNGDQVGPRLHFICSREQR